MPPKGKGKGKKGKKKKAVITPEERIGHEIEAFQRVLDEEYYIPQKLRASNSETHTTLLGDYSTAQQSATDGGGLVTDPNNKFPMSKLPTLLHTLGFDPSEAQTDEIIAATRMKGEGEGAVVSDNLDLAKLRVIIGDAKRTGVLASGRQPGTADAAVGGGGVLPPSMLSIAGESDLRECFDVLWRATGSRMTNNSGETATRCINTEQLKSLFGGDQQLVNVDHTLKADVLDALVTCATGAEDNQIREDTFLGKYLDVE